MLSALNAGGDRCMRETMNLDTTIASPSKRWRLLRCLVNLSARRASMDSGANAATRVRSFLFTMMWRGSEICAGDEAGVRDIRRLYDTGFLSAE